MEGSSEIKKMKEAEKTEMLSCRGWQRVRGDGGMRCDEMDGGRRSVCVWSLVLLN